MSAASVQISSARNRQLRALCQVGAASFDPLGNFSRNFALIQINDAGPKTPETEAPCIGFCVLDAAAKGRLPAKSAVAAANGCWLGSRSGSARRVPEPANSVATFVAVSAKLMPATRRPPSSPRGPPSEVFARVLNNLPRAQHRPAAAQRLPKNLTAALRSLETRGGES